MSVTTAEEAREQVITPPIYRGEYVDCVFALPAGVSFTPGATGLRFALGAAAEAPDIEVTEAATADGSVSVVDTTSVRVILEEAATAGLTEGRNRFTLYGTVSSQPRVWAAGNWYVRKGAGTL
jgi:hypothetical protein